MFVSFGPRFPIPDLRIKFQVAFVVQIPNFRLKSKEFGVQELRNTTLGNI